MTHGEQQQITFLDESGRALGADEVEAGAADDRHDRREARLDHWLPRGGGAALAGLLFVLVAWIGSTPLSQAVATLLPEADRTFGPAQGSNFGGGGYYGISPHAAVLVSFGTRSLLVVIALVLGLRARHVERSAVSTGCVAAASLSLALFVAAAIVMTIGVAEGHVSNFFGVF